MIYFNFQVNRNISSDGFSAGRTTSNLLFENDYVVNGAKNITRRFVGFSQCDLIECVC